VGLGAKDANGSDLDYTGSGAAKESEPTDARIHGLSLAQL